MHLEFSQICIKLSMVAIRNSDKFFGVTLVYCQRHNILPTTLGICMLSNSYMESLNMTSDFAYFLSLLCKSPFSP